MRIKDMTVGTSYAFRTDKHGGVRYGRYEGTTKTYSGGTKAKLMVRAPLSDGSVALIPYTVVPALVIGEERIVRPAREEAEAFARLEREERAKRDAEAKAFAEEVRDRLHVQTSMIAGIDTNRFGDYVMVLTPRQVRGLVQEIEQLRAGLARYEAAEQN